MNAVRRTRGIRKVIRTVICGEAAPKYVTAGAKNCGEMLREARSGRQHSGPSDRDIMTWAEFDLTREILGGFWEIRTA